MKKKEIQPIRDERIDRAANDFFAAQLPWMMSLQGVILLVKFMPDTPMAGWWLDAVAVCAAALTVLIWRTAKGLWGARDEVLDEIARQGDSAALLMQVLTTVLGALVAMLTSGSIEALDIGYVLSALPLLPLSVCTVVHFTGKGLYVPAARPQRSESRGRSMWKGIAAKGLSAAVTAGLIWLINRHEPDAWKRALLVGAICFVAEPLFDAAIRRISGKQADKAVMEAEGADEDETADA